MARLVNVSSSFIRAAGLDDNGDLVIQFSDGARFKYAGAGEDQLADLLSAPSAGRFFHNEIKNQYTASQV